MDPFPGSGSDALSYRHDGSSPLPLGLEWSPGPVRVGVGGGESVWLGVPADSWCFSVTIPAWVTVTPNSIHSPPGAAAAAAAMGPIDPFARASPIVLYRVAVTVRSPGGATRCLRLLRRFSDFLALHAALVNAFPGRPIPPPPPKHRLLFVSSNNTLISQRRAALQAWLTAVLEDLEVSRSPPVAAFLDLPEAARLAALSQEDDSAQERDPRDGSNTNTSNSTSNSNSFRDRDIDSSGAVGGAHGAFSAAGDSGSGADSRVEGESVSEGHRAVPEGAGAGPELSSELLEAYLSQRKGVGGGVPGDCQSTGGSSGLPSPSPASSFYRVLSASSLASLTLPPGADADTAGNDEARAQQPGTEASGPGEGAEAAAGAGAGASRRVGAGLGGGEEAGARIGASDDQGSSLGPLSETGDGTSAAGGGPPQGPPQPPPQPPPQLPPQLQAGHASSQQGDGDGDREGPLLVALEEARPAVHQQLAVLQRRLRVAQADMTALVERLQQEAAVSEFLTQKVKVVEAELDSERRGSGSAMAAAVAAREARLVAVEWELEGERGRLADALAAVASHQKREQSLEAQLQALDQRLQEVEGAKVQQKAQQGAEGGAGAESQAAERETLVGRAREEGRAQGRAEAERRAGEEGERAKGEVRALAKEVKSLRRALGAAQGEAAHQRQQAEAYRRLLEAEGRWAGERRKRKERTIHEVQVLAQRLRETAVTALGREAGVISAGERAGTPTAGAPTVGAPTAGVPAGEGAGKVQASVALEDGPALLAENLELLATSDSRIELILAEALLLKDLPELSQPGYTLQEFMELESPLQQGDNATNGHGGTGPPSSAVSLQNGGMSDAGKAGLLHLSSGVTSGGEVSGVKEGAAQVKQRLGEEESSDRELLFSAVGLLVEMAQQRRSINALLRHAYASKMQ